MQSKEMPAKQDTVVTVGSRGIVTGVMNALMDCVFKVVAIAQDISNFGFAGAERSR